MQFLVVGLRQEQMMKEYYSFLASRFDLIYISGIFFVFRHIKLS